MANTATGRVNQPTMAQGTSTARIASHWVMFWHPEAVASLILVEPSLHMVKHISISLLSTMARNTYARLIKRDPERAMDILYWWVFSYPTGGSAYDRFPEDWRLELRKNSGAINKESSQEASLYPSRSRVASIQVPIRCVVGEMSSYRKPSMYLAYQSSRSGPRDRGRVSRGPPR